MIFTAIGIVFLLTLGFLVITWVLWFTFLWLSKLWYETSSTHFMRITVRNFFHHSVNYIVRVLRMVYSRVTNHISKMRRSDIGLLFALVMAGVFTGLGYWTGFNQCYQTYVSGQAEMKQPEVFGGVYFLGSADGPSLYQFPSLDSSVAYQTHVEYVKWLKGNLKDSTLLYTEFW